MLEFLSDLSLKILPGLFEWILEKRSPSETRKEYEDLRSEIANTLVNCSRYYSNPILLSRDTPINIPEEYSNASDKLRDLGVRLTAFCQTMPEDIKDIPITKQQINMVAGDLIGLSNSITSWPNFDHHAKYVEIKEMEIKKILSLSIC